MKEHIEKNGVGKNVSATGRNPQRRVSELRKQGNAFASKADVLVAESSQIINLFVLNVGRSRPKTIRNGGRKFGQKHLPLMVAQSAPVVTKTWSVFLNLTTLMVAAANIVSSSVAAASKFMLGSSVWAIRLGSAFFARTATT